MPAPDYTPQRASTMSRREMARETFGDDTMGDDTLARYGRDVRQHPSMDWQEREDSADNFSDEHDMALGPLADARVAGMPAWGRPSPGERVRGRRR